MSVAFDKAVEAVTSNNETKPEIDLQKIVAMVELVRYLDQGLKVH